MSLRCAGNRPARNPRRGRRSDSFSASLPFSRVALRLSASLSKLDSELEDTKFGPTVGKFAEIGLSSSRSPSSVHLLLMSQTCLGTP